MDSATVGPAIAPRWTPPLCESARRTLCAGLSACEPDGILCRPSCRENHLGRRSASGEVEPSGSDAGWHAAPSGGAVAAAAAAAAVTDAASRTSGAGRWILHSMRRPKSVSGRLLHQLRPAKKLKRACAFSQVRMQPTCVHVNACGLFEGHVITKCCVVLQVAVELGGLAWLH